MMSLQCHDMPHYIFKATDADTGTVVAYQKLDRDKYDLCDVISLARKYVRHNNLVEIFQPRDDFEANSNIDAYTLTYNKLFQGYAPYNPVVTPIQEAVCNRDASYAKYAANPTNTNLKQWLTAQKHYLEMEIENLTVTIGSIIDEK